MLTLKEKLPTRLDYNHDLEEAHKYSYNNKKLLTRFTDVACFYCISFYTVAEIKEWVNKATTALCPKCGIDSVIPNPDNLLNESMLREMYQYFFEHSIYSVKMKDGAIVDITDVDNLYNPSEFSEYKKYYLKKIKINPKKMKKVLDKEF